MSNRLKILSAVLAIVALIFIAPFFTTRSGRNESESVAQRIEENKTKTDNLRNAMRYLTRMTPMNRGRTTQEVQLELNTWIQTVDRTEVQYSPPKIVDSLPADQLEFVGCRSPLELQFSELDIDYLFERRMMQKLSSWIVAFPLRDSLVQHMLDKKKDTLSVEEGLKLEEACKLFDWVMRNVALEQNPNESNLISVESKTPTPSGEIMEGGYGYGYLPWETLLFSFGDYIEKGRVFNALAYQRGIPAAWIAQNGNLWAVGVAIGDEIVLFEPKLAMPVPDPDKLELATLKEAQQNSRILRRLDLPGRFDYAYDAGDLDKVELLIDLPPTAASARMKMLEQKLLGDERMILFHDVDEVAATFQKASPQATVRMWRLPLSAQIHAALVREKLKSITDFTGAYMAQHGIWMMDNPAANGRLNHLFGKFEATDREDGALSMYMDCRTDEESLRRLTTDPAVQKELGVHRLSGEDPERYAQRIQQAEYVLRRAKVDASFLMAQLHYDRGDYTAAKNWFQRRVIENKSILATRWFPIAHYGLARTHQELGEIDLAEEELTFEPSPMEAGNRLRLRYLKTLSDEVDSNTSDTDTIDSDTIDSDASDERSLDASANSDVTTDDSAAAEKN